jgi:DNA repair exonuclease SbcCD ATPase subunit
MTTEPTPAESAQANPSEATVDAAAIADQIGKAQATQTTEFETKMDALRAEHQQMAQMQEDATRTATEAKALADQLAAMITTLGNTLEQQQQQLAHQMTRLDGMSAVLKALGSKLGVEETTLAALSVPPASNDAPPGVLPMMGVQEQLDDNKRPRDSLGTLPG